MIIEFHGFVGSGKSTILAYIARQLNAGKSAFGLSPHDAVFSSLPLPNCYKLEPERIGTINIRSATLLIDEVSAYFDNRNFVNFLKDTMMYFKLSRHYDVDIVICSQSSNDADKKIRELVQRSYIVEKMGCFTVAKEIEKWHSVAGGVPTEKYKLAPPVKWTVIYRPALYADFDSYQAPELPAFVPELWECQQMPDKPAKGVSLPASGLLAHLTKFK